MDSYNSSDASIARVRCVPDCEDIIIIPMLAKVVMYVVGAYGTIGKMKDATNGVTSSTTHYILWCV